MAGTVNKVILVGNLGKDPETVRFDNSGGMLVKFPLATSENYTNRAGERVSQTEWHNIVVGKKGLAEVCEKYLRKGVKIYLEGKIRTREYTDSTGQKRYITEIQADEMTMLTSREEPRAESDGNDAGYPASAPQTGVSPAQPETDLPF
jgi:single-strand DNA-binding protein